MKDCIEDIYRTRICHWCRERFKDGDKYYQDWNREVFLCQKCKDLLINPPDFDSKGSTEKGTTSWKTANILTLIRDDCHCRVCTDGHIEKRHSLTQVHHIIPRKNGGTHNLKNLITLCEDHHRETFKNSYVGLELIDRHIQLGKQAVLTV